MVAWLAQFTKKCCNHTFEKGGLADMPNIVYKKRTIWDLPYFLDYKTHQTIRRT